jgi:hypothetical protein
MSRLSLNTAPASCYGRGLNALRIEGLRHLDRNWCRYASIPCISTPISQL